LPKKLVDKIRIFDTTLRDGDQTPGVFLAPEDKVTIARQLDRLGVDAIEAGTPVSSKGEFETAQLIAKEGLNAEIFGLARVVKEDVDAVVSSGLKYIHLFIATSDIHLKHKLRMTREQALQNSLEAIDYAKSQGMAVEFSAEDATRTEIGFLKDFYKAVVGAGVIRINIPDTVGIMTPNKMSQLVKEVRVTVDKPISVHCHNDFGMAVANSLSGVEAGAEQIHVTINGLGERAGNAALEETVTALNLLYKKKTNIKNELIYQTSQLVSKLTRIPVQPNKAVVGENAFTHQAGIHTHGLVSMPLTYEPIPPEFVGRSRKIIPGKHSGRHGINAQLEDWGLNPTDEQVKEITEKVRAMGEKGKVVTDVDLINIARSVMGEAFVEEKKIIELSELAVMTGTRMTSTASVRVILNDKEYTSAETGVGPVDAAMRAIQKITRDLNVSLKEYRLEALTGGSDAVAEVIIKVEDKDGNTVTARAAKEDIVKASVEAMITAINRLLLRRGLSTQ
jgi:2-isopropylmalate synthase